MAVEDGAKPVAPARRPLGYSKMLVSVCRSIAAVGAAVFAPWTVHRRIHGMSAKTAALTAGVHVLIAAVVSTLLSTWTYLAGKGLALGLGEMDLGHDDLPPDTLRQVVVGAAGAMVMWTLLLVLAIIVCLLVADLLYRDDRVNFRVAARGACVATAWFVVWASAVFAANGLRRGEVRHPKQAVRVYAQLVNHGFRGSSAQSPGMPEREPLTAPGRLRMLALGFPVLWSVGLPPANGRSGRSRRSLAIATGIVLSWLAWAAVWRLLPWTSLELLAG